MAFWLRSAERRVQARARRVRGDADAVETAARSLATGVRQELARPKVLLAFFAAGLGFGWLRRVDGRRVSRTGDEVQSASATEVQTGRIAKLVAAVLAGARIYEQVRRAVAFVEKHGSGKADIRPASPSDDMFDREGAAAELSRVSSGSAPPSATAQGSRASRARQAEAGPSRPQSRSPQRAAATPRSSGLR